MRRRDDTRPPVGSSCTSCASAPQDPMPPERRSMQLALRPQVRRSRQRLPSSEPSCPCPSPWQLVPGRPGVEEVRPLVPPVVWRVRLVGGVLWASSPTGERSCTCRRTCTFRYGRTCGTSPSSLRRPGRP
eukprot:9502826-Heterocapsa_arctica.AAC.1